MKGWCLFWLVVSNSRDDSSFPVVRPVLAELESGKFHLFRAMTGFPMDVADFENGKHINIVCTLKVDHTHITHLMTLLNDGCDFHLDGLLNGSLDSYSILGSSLSCQLPMPKAFTDEKTKILSHFTLSWEGMPNLIDPCSGFGGLAHGAIAAGMHVMVAVDQNPKMFAHYGKIREATKICGDFGCQEVLVGIWQHVKGAKVTQIRTLRAKSPREEGTEWRWGLGSVMFGLLIGVAALRQFRTLGLLLTTILILLCVGVGAVCPPRQLHVCPGRAAWTSWFMLTLMCRIGEAMNPGPDEGRSHILGTFNPIGLKGKALHRVSHLAHGDIWAVSETQFCAQSMQAFRSGLHFAESPYRYCVGGHPVLAQNNRIVHPAWRGVALPSKFPTRPLPSPWPRGIYALSRVQVTATLEHDTWLTGATVYGEPESATYPQQKQNKDHLLLCAISQVWSDGAEVSNLGLLGFSFRQHTRWFIKLLKVTLKHMGVSLTMGCERPDSQIFQMHTGVLALPWDPQRMILVYKWMLANAGQTFKRQSRLIVSLPFGHRMAVPCVCFTLGLWPP